MPPIDLDCPRCGEPIRVPARLAGRRTECPECEKSFTVPESDPAPGRGRGRRSEDADDDPPPRRGRGRADDEDRDDDPPPRRGRGRAEEASPRTGGRMVWLIAGGAALVVAAAVGLVLFLTSKGGGRGVSERDAAVSRNNLKQIGLGVHNYHDNNQRFPPPDGKVPFQNPGGGLSWRVHILPYVEQEALYRQFNLNAPWDSPGNKALIAQMPKVFASPGAPAGPGETYYKTFTGPNTLFTSVPNLNRVLDGTANTLMVVEGGPPVIWTKPDDIPFTGRIDAQALYFNGSPRINVATADGAVRVLELDRLKPETLDAVITPAGGEIINDPNF